MVPLIPPASRAEANGTVDMREVMNGIMYVLSPAASGGIPKDLPPESTVHDYLDLWIWMARWIASIMRFMWNVASKATRSQPHRRHHR